MIPYLYKTAKKKIGNSPDTTSGTADGERRDHLMLDSKYIMIPDHKLAK
jgi:hypothetical protein